MLSQIITYRIRRTCKECGETTLWNCEILCNVCKENKIRNGEHIQENEYVQKANVERRKFDVEHEETKLNELRAGSMDLPNRMNQIVRNQTECRNEDENEIEATETLGHENQNFGDEWSGPNEMNENVSIGNNTKENVTDQRTECEDRVREANDEIRNKGHVDERKIDGCIRLLCLNPNGFRPENQMKIENMK